MITIRILIADDVSQNRYLLETILKGNGYEVDSAKNGAEALELARKNPPDLIITDILMPVMDGFELCRHWKSDEQLKHIPFVFYTATYTDPRDEQFALNLGADRFITKPQEPEALMQIVKDLMDEYQKGALETTAKPLGDEMEILRQYNEILFHKLEKKVMSLNNEIAERKKSEDALRESEKRFRDLARLLPALVYEIDLQGKFLFVNDAAYSIFGYSPEDAAHLELDVSMLLTSESRKLLEKNMKELLAGKNIGPALYDGVKKDGTVFPMEVYGSLIMKEGKPVGVRGVAIDITERKAAEDQIKKSLREKESLLREIHHRVKNNLQVINSLISLQQEHISDEKASAAFVDIHNRVMSMAMVHEMLYTSGIYTEIKLSSYVNTMALNLFNTYHIRPENVSLKTVIDDIPLDVDMAIPCSIIINELISNSLKHAFPGGKKGEISIEFYKSTDSNAILTIRDNGVGMPEDIDLESSKNFGLWLVKILTEQLGGTVVFGRDKGTKTTVEFPVKFRISKDAQI